MRLGGRLICEDCCNSLKVLSIDKGISISPCSVVGAATESGTAWATFDMVATLGSPITILDRFSDAAASSRSKSNLLLTYCVLCLGNVTFCLYSG